MMRHGLADDAPFFERRRFVMVRRFNNLDAEKSDEYPSHYPETPSAR
jgi:hypothetical protein